MVLALALGGCDAIGERLAEEGAEQLTGGEIDVDDEGVSFESDEGSFSSGAELPEDFPSSVPLPDDGELVNASRIDTEDGLGWMVNVQFDSGEPGPALEAQVDAATAAGFAPPEDDGGDFQFGDGEGGGMSSRILENDSYTLIMSTIGEPGDFILGLQVFEQQPE